LVVYKKSIECTHHVCVGKWLLLEAEILNDSHHEPNIVELVKVVTHTVTEPNHAPVVRVCGLVLDYVEGCHLPEMLKFPDLNVQDRLGLAHGCASVWEALHRSDTYVHQGVAYRQFGPNNVVVRQQFLPNNVVVRQPVLVGLGLTRSKNCSFSCDQLPRSRNQNVDAYGAPERLECVCPQRITPKADVFSFGVLLPEIMSGKRWSLPVNQKRGQEALIVPRTFFSARIDEKLQALVHECLAVNPKERLDMRDVSSRLEAMKTELQD